VGRLTAPVNVTRTLDPTAKRAAIMAAGEELFASCGFAKTTMAQIAAKAEVAVGSLYRAFPDKLALLTALHDAMEQKFVDAILASWDLELTAEARFRRMIAAIMDQTVAVQSSMPLYMLTRDLVSSGGQEPGARTIAVIAKLYEAGVGRGEFVAIHPSTAAAIGYGMVEGGMRDWMAAGGDATELQIVVDVMTGCFVRAFVVSSISQS
jgi:AcrR family transcriptional regulator